MKRLLLFLALVGFTGLALATDSQLSCLGTTGCQVILQPRNGSGTAINGVTVASLGGVQLGPSVTNNFNGRQSTVSGGLYSANVTTTDESGLFYIGNNVRHGGNTAGAGRTSTTTGGTGIALDNYASDTTAAISLVTNKGGDATSTNATAVMTFTQEGLQISTFKGTNGTSHGFWTIQVAANQACNTSCQTEPTGLNSSSGACLTSWTSGKVPQACATAAANNYCLCFGIP